MLDTALLSSIATQMMTSSWVHLAGKSLFIRRTSAQHLRTHIHNERPGISGHRTEPRQAQPMGTIGPQNGIALQRNREDYCCEQGMS